MTLANLRKPVRNLPTMGSRHQCSLIVTTDESGNELPDPINLRDELVCKQNSLENGMIFTCGDIVTVAGKEQACGKEWVLHYPTTFAWKVRRTLKEEAATEPIAEAPAQEPAASGRKGKH